MEILTVSPLEWKGGQSHSMRLLVWYRMGYREELGLTAERFVCQTHTYHFMMLGKSCDFLSLIFFIWRMRIIKTISPIVLNR